MAAKNGAHFTYFLSCTFLMNQAAKKAYQAPHQKQGKSNVGFAQSDDEIRERLGNIWHAHLEGHDISSHACGHFDGRQWSEADWSKEFSTFHATLKNAWKSVDLEEPNGWQDLVDHGIRGFRAPYLSATPGADMIAAEKKAGFTYDASLVTKGPAVPVEEAGIVRFGLPLIPEGPREKPIIGMDYNLFVRTLQRHRGQGRLEGVRRPLLRGLQGGIRQAIFRQTHAAAARLPFRGDERRRLLARARPACQRCLSPRRMSPASAILRRSR